MSIKEKIEYYRNKQIEIIAAEQAAKKLMEEYKAEFKKDFGFCDGEPTNVLQIVEAIAKVNDLSSAT